MRMLEMEIELHYQQYLVMWEGEVNDVFHLQIIILTLSSYIHVHVVEVGILGGILHCFQITM